MCQQIKLWGSNLMTHLEMQVLTSSCKCLHAPHGSPNKNSASSKIQAGSFLFSPFYFCIIEGLQRACSVHCMQRGLLLAIPVLHSAKCSPGHFDNVHICESNASNARKKWGKQWWQLYTSAEVSGKARWLAITLGLAWCEWLRIYLLPRNKDVFDNVIQSPRILLANIFLDV